MPLRPDIILQAGNVPRHDPMRTYANALAIKDVQKRNALAEQEQEQKILEQQQEAALEQELSALPRAADGGLDLPAMRDVLVKHGRREEAFKLEGMIGKRADAGSKPPTTRTLKRGSSEVTQTWDPARKSWVDEAEAPRWNPNSKGFGATITGYDEQGRPLMSVGTMGGGGPVPTVKADTTVERAAQTGLQSGWETVGRLERIRDLYDPEFLTFGGRLDSAVSGLADKAGVANPEQRKLIRKRRQFAQNVDREFNAYRKEITGAAASVQEMEDLKKSMMSTDLGPTEFEAAFDEYSAEVRRSMRIKARLLREGVRVGSDEFGKRFDELFLGGADDDVGARARELEAAGLSEDEGTARLRAEGYL